MIKIVKLSSIYFKQDSLKYDNNNTLKNMFEKLKDGKETIDEITKRTPLNVYFIQKCYTRDIYYSCNDRRICVFKDYEKYLKKNFHKNLNKNFGLSISVVIHENKQPYLNNMNTPDECVPLISNGSIIS